ncbi:LegC family aminotransferase [Fundidesulfovibrio putealis]|uniref:LegC family aminotransferase n=1 Tax=Fundidesulfovibrio putealis TaxID=270496 RepID=UPI0005B82781|nr:LegC family aminotransferase [Fundidesulfovibrio putealis]
MTIDSILERIERVLAGFPRPVALHEPLLGEAEREAVARCVESGWVSYLGPDVERLERRLEEIHGGGHAVATASGTAALHLALVLVGVQPGDEVLMPPLTFAATANAAVYAGATPHFVDIEPRSLGACPERLERHLARTVETVSGQARNKATGRRVAALVAVHVFGHPAMTKELEDVCRRFGIILVEDAAESLGSLQDGVPVGRRGAASALSFNGNKIVTAGGGGALLCPDAKSAALARHLATTAKAPHPWKLGHDRLGFNYRMPNLNASLALAQLGRLDEFLARKRTLASRYAEAFAGLEGARVLAEPPGSRSNYWLNTILLEDSLLPVRDELFGKIREAGILIRPAWELVSSLPHFAHCPRSGLEVSQDMQPRVVNLPSSAALA